MTAETTLALSGVVALGMAAQWLGWRIRLPSILLLLVFGIIAGPVTGLLQPDKLLGPLLEPLVSLFVAVILFEGGLSLRLRDLQRTGIVVVRLISMGLVVTWISSALLARYLLGFPWAIAALTGAILTVTGPTVIGPLLRNLRLGGRVGAILRWEGIAIDPVGASLAVMTFAAVRAGELYHAGNQIAYQLMMTVVVGVGLGTTSALFLKYAMRQFWIPDLLQGATALALVLLTFATSNYLQAESGLLAVTLMGMTLANQRSVPVKHVMEFKENLTVVLISCLFILLASRLQRDSLLQLDWRAIAFVTLLIVVVRPLGVWVSTVGSELRWQERLFLSWLAPRGIVAAAVSSIFALEMRSIGFEEAGRLPPVIFLTIFGTVLVYGLTAAPLAYRLQLATANPQGLVFVGAAAWVRGIAKAIQDQGFPVLLVDSTWSNVTAARQMGLAARYESILAEDALHGADLAPFGRLLAVTANDEVNSLACLRFIELFGRREVYQLPFSAPAEGRREAVNLEQRGRLLFDELLSYAELVGRFGDKPKVKVTSLTEKFGFESMMDEQQDSALPLFLVRGKTLLVFTAKMPPKPKAGDRIVSLVKEPVMAGGPT